ncbi:hypothetical protein [Enterococcus faecalis]|uniref:hypothetical protein n=1 Tax=Enterococcus faecalis TaxID=1351 RepID=UPI001A9584AC|nr:hypothetical protein [Enterococcus faecalis]MBO1137588.1 hypothetical protein [Enterococcus faecalis]
MDILKEVELVGIETFPIDDGSLMAKITVLEDYPDFQSTGKNKYYGKTVGFDYVSNASVVLPFAQTLPCKITLVKGLVKNDKNRDVVRLITIQEGWQSEKRMSNAVDKIASNKSS